MGISKKSWTGLAFESPRGNAAATPTVYHPCKTKFDNKKKFIYLSEDRGSRDANTKRKASVRSASGEISGTFYLDTSPRLLYGFMGKVDTDQPDADAAPTAYRHKLALADTPPVMTVFKGYDVAGYYFGFSAVEKYSLKFSADGKLLEESADIQSRYGQKISGANFAALVPEYSDDELPGEGTIFSGYTPTLKFNSTASDLVEDMELEFSQKLTLYFAINGSKDFVRIYYGDREAKLNFTASFDDTALWDRYDQEQDDHIEVEFLGSPFGASTVREKLSFDFPLVGYDEMEMDTSKEYIQIKAKATARPGTTLNSTFSAEVVNAVESYAL